MLTKEELQVVIRQAKKYPAGNGYSWVYGNTTGLHHNRLVTELRKNPGLLKRC